MRTDSDSWIMINENSNLSLELDEDIRNTEWDFILVDAPTGYHPNKPK